MGQMNRLDELLNNTLEELQNIIKDKNLEGPEIVEFLDEFFINIDVAVANKKKLALIEFEKMIEQEQQNECIQEYKAEQDKEYYEWGK